MTLRYIGVMACSPRGVIGFKGKLPWNYPEELDFFRRTTKDVCRIMGYRTYLAMPKEALRDRINIVFSRSHRQEKEGSPAQFVSSWEEFKKIKAPANSCMIGGAQICRLFLEKDAISRFILTKIHKEYEGDVFMPLEFTHSWVSSTIFSTQDFKVLQYERPPHLDPSHSSR